MDTKDFRPTWEETFVDIAKVISKRSKDPKTQVGAVLVKNNCVIGTGYLVPRSSIAKKGLIVHNALIDPGYTGEIHLIITNCSSETYNFEKGDRLGSIIITPVMDIEWEEKTELSVSDRGSNAFGSSGK